VAVYRPCTAALLVAASPAAPGIGLAAPPCTAAVVHGDESLAGAVRRILEARGIATAGRADCPATTATVRWTAAGVETVVADGAGHPQVQVVSDPMIAATVIESWARADLSADLLESRAGPRVVPLRDDEDPPPPPPPVPPATTPASFAVTTGVGRGDDASVWLDGTVSGTFAIGAGVHAGALVRTLFDLEQGGDTERLPGGRRGVDVLVTADYPVRPAGLHLSPGLGFGAGWLRTSADHGPDGGRGDDEDLGGLRLEAHVGCRVPVGRAIALDAAIGANVSPLARPGDVTDFDEGVTMAGEPRWTLRGGLGARFGDP
jgi:hypothetical protein